MKRFIATFSITALLAFGAPLQAEEVEKETLNFEEIAQLAVEEQADKAQIEEVEGGLKSGAGLLILAVVAVGIAVAG